MAESAMTSELYDISLLLSRRSGQQEVSIESMSNKVYWSHLGMLESDMAYCDAAAAAAAHCYLEN
eukprot:scaffold18718_cov45-Attheya_sp.AAC.7